MRKRFLFFLFILLSLSFAIPAESRPGGPGYRHSGPGFRNAGPGYHGGPRMHWGHRGHYPRFYIGSSFIMPWYVPVAPPVYVYTPSVVYETPPQNQPYAYPDPEFIEKYKKSENSSSEWVTVPGQWIDGKWVPPHNVQVPAN